jgi:DNA-binding transcriptional LysR family regulator
MPDFKSYKIISFPPSRSSASGPSQLPECFLSDAEAHGLTLLAGPHADKPATRNYTHAIMERNGTDYSLFGLEILSAVAGTSSLVKAGETLGITGSAVSKQLTKLEARLGVRLLRRTTRSVSLSPAGLQLATEYAKARAILGDAIDAVRADGSGPRGSLRVSAPPAFGIHVLPRILKEFVDQYPEVVVDLDLSGRIVNVTSEGFDVAIRVAKSPPQDYVVVEIGTIEWGICASEEYVSRFKSPRIPNDLKEHRYISSSSKAGSFRLELASVTGMERVTLTPALITQSVEATLALVVEGAGLGALPDYLMRQPDDQAELMRLLPKWTVSGEHGNRLYALMLPGRSLRPAARAFVEFLRMALSGRTILSR